MPVRSLRRSDQSGADVGRASFPSWPPITHPVRSSPRSPCRRRRLFPSPPSPSSRHGHPICHSGHSVACSHRGTRALLHKVRLSPPGQALPPRPRFPSLLGVPPTRFGPRHSLPVCTLQEPPPKDARTVACTPRSSRPRGHHHPPGSGSVVRRQARRGPRGRQTPLGGQQTVWLHCRDRKRVCYCPRLLCMGRSRLCPIRRPSLHRPWSRGHGRLHVRLRE